MGFESTPLFSTIRSTGTNSKIYKPWRHGTVLSSGSFSSVFLFYLWFLAFMTQCAFSLSNLTCSLILVCLLVFFCLCMCMYLIFFRDFIFLLLLDLLLCVYICILKFSILPIIHHGKSKDGIQPFKGPKPAARIANSLENREYWEACRDWHTSVPPTCPPTAPSPP